MGNVYKATAASGFSIISNELIRDADLNLAAFRLVCWIQSHVEGFKISFSSISKALKFGQDRIKSAVKSAEENGYLVRIKRQDPKTGLFDWDYYVFATKADCLAFKAQKESPATQQPQAIKLPTDHADNQGGGNPGVGSPDDGKHPPHKKNNKKITKEEDQTHKSENLKIEICEGGEGNICEEKIEEEVNEKQLVIEAEIVEDSAITTILQPQTNSSAVENDHDFQSLAGTKDLRSGKQYEQWEGRVRSKNGRVQVGVKPEFLAYVMKRNAHKPYFKAMKGSELMRATQTWISRHTEESRSLWEDFTNGEPEDARTIAQMQFQERKQKLHEKLNSMFEDIDNGGGEVQKW